MGLTTQTGEPINNPPVVVPPSLNFDTTGLLGFWQGANTADVSGNGRTLGWGGPPVYAAGRTGCGNAFSLNYGVPANGPAYVACPSIAHGIGTGDFTLAAWIYINEFPTTGSGWMVATNGADMMEFNVDPTSKKIRLYVGAWKVFDTALSPGQWYHVAVVRRNVAGTETLFGYINGVQEATTFANATSVVNGILYIGANSYSTGRADGLMQSVLWMARAMSAVEIAALVSATWYYNLGGTTNFGLPVYRRTGYEPLANWNLLPNLKIDETSQLAASTDRSVPEANNDFNNYESTASHNPQTTFPDTVTENVTIKTITGPGIITRIWCPHYNDSAYNLGVTVDGQSVITGSEPVVLSSTPYVAGSPLIGTILGGHYSYEPIPFKSSCVITSNNVTGAYKNYYQIEYHLCGSETRSIPSFTGTLTPEQTTMKAQIVTMLNGVGGNPAGVDSLSTVLTTAAATIAAGASVTLANLTGNGWIRALGVNMTSATDMTADMDALHLRVYYDGSATPAIDVPVAHFFGAGHGRVAPWRSLPIGNTGTGYNLAGYCYWPMPYGRPSAATPGVVVQLVNTGATSIASTEFAGATVEYSAGLARNDQGQLCAAWNEAVPAGTGYTTNLSTLLNLASGVGHYVGNLMYLTAAAWTAFEGNDITTINPGDASQIVIEGTGMEDAYNGAYFWNQVAPQVELGAAPNWLNSPGGDGKTPTSGGTPIHGLLQYAGTPTFRTDVFRWRISDYVPFTHGILIQQQNETIAPTLRGSVAFYYLL